MSSPDLEGFRTVASRREYTGVLSNVRVDTLEDSTGTRFDREVVEHVDAVAVVAVTDADEVVLVRQYRHPFGAEQLEIPAGLRDVDDEPPARAAVRELSEETSFAPPDASAVSELLVLRNSAGWTDEVTTIYLATDVRDGAAPDGFVAEHEEAAMEVVRMPLPEVLAAVDAGEITDAKTVVGLLMAARRLG